MNLETNIEINRIILSLSEFLQSAFEKSGDLSWNLKPKLEIASLDELKVYNLKRKLIDRNLQELDEIVNRMKDKEYAKIDERVKKVGIEALACYRPFHFLPTEFWGIYIFLDGLRYIKSIFRNSRFQREFNMGHVIDVLWQHEVFHFLVELFSTNIEFIASKRKYLDYLKEIYPKNRLEEALANANVLKREKMRDLKLVLRDFFDNQPSGYNEYYRFEKGKRFRIGQQELANLVAYSKNEDIPLGILEVHNSFNVDINAIPTYLIAASEILEIPGVLEQVVKIRKLIRFLQRYGFKKERQKGSHAIYKDNKGKIINLPIHSNGCVHHKALKDVQEALNMTRKEILREI